MLYPARFDGDNLEGGYVVTFPDFPEAVTQGEDLGEAMEMARDSLRMAIAYRIEHAESVPPPNVDRLFDFDGATQVDPLEAAFAALGKRLVIGVEDAA